MPCKNCEYFDENDKWGYKGYCSYYRAYYDPDDKVCSHFKGGNDGCFLTTACCQYKGLPDDCYELTVLRKYRDEYMKINPDGKILVEEYYKIAPKIVEKINHESNNKQIYEYIYSEITQCVSMIEKNEYEAVCEKYKTLVLNLKMKYFY